MLLIKHWEGDGVQDEGVSVPGRSNHTCAHMEVRK
jgi:hypothetical protein